MTDDAAAGLTEAVLASRKYRAVSRELVESLARAELAKGRAPAEAEKAVRAKLHQIALAYRLEPKYDRWLDELRAADDPRPICREAMRHHASTRERVPILDRFYAETLAGLGPIRSVVDLGCGLNPLAIPWMGLVPDAEYAAYDVLGDLIAFLGAALPLLGVLGHAEVKDARAVGPLDADLVLALKLLPLLEQLDREAPRRLLESVGSGCLLASYPAASLGGKKKGFEQTYEARFRELAAGWEVRTFRFPGELAFLARRDTGG